MPRHEPREKRAIVVLGMHRSGTSALSRAVSFYGYAQPHDLMPPGPDNPKGFWEAVSIVRLNEKMLGALGASWDRPGPFLGSEQTLHHSRELVMRRLENCYAEDALHAIDRSYGDATQIVVKDPRITVLLPFWMRILERAGFDLRFLLICRNPLAVAESLKRRNGFSRAKSLLLWQHYNLEALKLEGQGRLDQVIAYEQFVRTPVACLESLSPKSATSEGIKSSTESAVDEFVSPADRHDNVASDAPFRDDSVPRIVQHTWSLLCTWSRLTRNERFAIIADLEKSYEDAVLFAGAPIHIKPSDFAPRDVSPVSAEADGEVLETNRRVETGPLEQPDVALTAARTSEDKEQAESEGCEEENEAVGDRPLLLHYHLFKNAGTSVDEMLKHNFGSRWAEAEFKTPAHRSNVDEVAEFLRERPHLLAFSSHTAALPLPQIEGRRVLPILFIRHPIDRIRSAYAFERAQAADTFGARLAKSTDFAGYVRELLSRPMHRQARNFQTYRLAFNEPAEAGAELDRALRALDQLPFVGLVEAYEASLEQLEAAFSPFVPGFQAISVRKNVSRTRHWNLDDRLAEIEEELGTSLYRELYAANSDDLDVFAKVAVQYAP